jgi:hypothetical protein
MHQRSLWICLSLALGTAVTAVLLRKSDREFRRKCPRKMLKFTPIERIVVALTSGVVTEKRCPEGSLVLKTPDLSGRCT